MYIKYYSIIKKNKKKQEKVCFFLQKIKKYSKIKEITY